MKARCPISYFVYGDDGVKNCPGLVFKDGRFWCHLAEYSGLAKVLYIGEGCSSSMFNTQRDAFLAGKGEEYLNLQCDKEAEEKHWSELTDGSGDEG